MRKTDLRSRSLLRLSLVQYWSYKVASTSTESYTIIVGIGPHANGVAAC